MTFLNHFITKIRSDDENFLKILSDDEDFPIYFA